MRLFVIDTNIYIDYILKGSRCFSKLVNTFFQQFEHDQCILYVPTICFWEIAKKILIGKLRIKGHGPEETLKLIHKPLDIPGSNFRDAPLTRKAAAIAPTFASKLSDPFDQLIVASALDANLPLITKDINIQKSKLIRTVW